MKKSTTVLRALTPEAERALGGAREIPITSYPFRVGRDSREFTGALALGSPERRVLLETIDNHLRLHDEGEPKVISRQHFQIRKNSHGGYVVEDRGSVCGTVVGHRSIGGHRKGGSCPLHDGNVIIVGGPDSPFVFQFLEVNEAESDGGENGLTG